MKLVVATGNQGKLQEMQTLLADLNCELELKPAALEIEETGNSFYENACLKAAEVAKVTQTWAIADDSGLEVEALDGAPGIYSARYGNTNQERIQRLLQALEGEKNRKARFVCVVAIAAPDGSIKLSAEGICHGEIIPTPYGTGGFGYDPIFYVPQLQQTFAAMPSEVKRQISHRGKAFQQLLPQLKNLVKELESS